MDDTTDTLVEYPQLKTEFGIGFNQRYLLRLERKIDADGIPAFPPRIHIGSRKIAWSRRELAAYIERKKAQRTH